MIRSACSLVKIKLFLFGYTLTLKNTFLNNILYNRVDNLSDDECHLKFYDCISNKFHNALY